MANVDVDWPDGLKRTLEWYSGLNLEIVRNPSLACMLAGVSFFRRLLGYVFETIIRYIDAFVYYECRYALGPIVLILILILPWVYSRMRCSREIAHTTFRHFMLAMLFGRTRC